MSTSWINSSLLKRVRLTAKSPTSSSVTAKTNTNKFTAKTAHVNTTQQKPK